MVEGGTQIAYRMLQEIGEVGMGVAPAIDSSAPPHPSSKVVPFVVGAGALALLDGGLGFELWRSRPRPA